MAEKTYRLAVLGGGPGGYVAAIRAAQLGLETVVIEREHLGGICLNWGCVPTKALLKSAELFATLHRLGDFGLAADNPRFDLEQVVKRSRKIADRLNAGIAYLLKKNKVTVIEGSGRLAAKGRIAITDGAGEPGEITAQNIIIATGARARDLPGLEADGKRIWTYKHAMVPTELPKRLLVVGSGAIGIEFASFYRHLGAEVTVVEVVDRILPVEDEEIAGLAHKAFHKQGINILTSARVDGLKAGKTSVLARISVADKAQEIEVDRVIVAVGITGNVEDIGLEDAGVTVEKGHIPVNEWGETGVPGIFAIGDVAGPPWLAHKASHEGIVAVERIAGVAGAHPLDVGNIPACTYSMPQIASVGLSEQAARAQGFEVRVGRFPAIANGRALAVGKTDGLVKTLFDAKTGALLGAHMIGAEVSEMIQGFAIARTLETTEAELIRTVFPHPTLSEMMHEAVLDAFGRVIHY